MYESTQSKNRIDIFQKGYCECIVIFKLKENTNVEFFKISEPDPISKKYSIFNLEFPIHGCHNGTRLGNSHFFSQKQINRSQNVKSRDFEELIL